MADSSLIPDILDHIVYDEIIPRLPWHTRPLLMAFSIHWWNAFEGIGVQGGNRLNPILGERMARATRLKQPLKCRLAMEYNHTYRDRQNQFILPGYVLKLFDGQWRNVAPISGRGPYTYTSSLEGLVLGVVDGMLYFVQRVAGYNLGIRIIALDVGGGLWQWNEISTSENHDYIVWHICKSGRAAGDLFVYRRCREESDLDLDFYFEIREIPKWEQISDRAPDEQLQHCSNSPRPNFVQVGNRLYFFGALPYKENVRFLDLNTRAWNASKVVSDFRGSYNIQKDVLLVAYNRKHFHILRYDSLNKRWIRAARMLAPPDDPLLRWTWCVEYDEQGEKQLWIYIFSQAVGEAFNIYKLRVVERLWGRVLARRAWDDIVLCGREVECELVDRTPVDQSFQPLEPFHGGNAPTMFVRTFHGFHRSDSTNFQDIPN